MITGKHIAETAINSGLIGTPYSEMDCQAFVEVILKKAGLNIINYRGSNHMWRELVECRQKVADHEVPAGALAFIVKHDGGEVKRGYHDQMGNAVHVAIALGDGRVMESTAGGVQFSSLKRFTDFGLIENVVYKGGEEDEGEGCPDAKSTILNALVVIANKLLDLEDYVYENL